MPYKSNDELPDNVKNSLPSEAQSIWRNAFNSSHEKDGDEEKAVRIAWGAIKNAGWSKDGEKWVKMSKNTHSFDAEIFSVGTWNGDKYTDADLDDMVKNFNTLKNEVKPPIKLGHNKDQMKDGNPALGWITGIKKSGKKLIGTFSDVPEIVYKAIKSNRYKRISSEIYWNLKHGGKTFKRVLAAVALLGADIPAVTNLADLEAYLIQSNESSFDTVKLYSFDTDEDGKLKTLEARKENKMAEENKELKELIKKVAALEATLEDTKGEVQTYKSLSEESQNAKKDAEKKAREYEEKLQNLKKETEEKLQTTRMSEFKDWAEKMVKEFKMLPAGRDLLFGDEKHTYTKEVGFQVPFETFKAYVEMQAKVLDPKEVSRSDKEKDKHYDDVNSKIDAMARTYAAENKMAYGEALTVILREHPELAEEYIEDTQVDKDSD